MATGVSQKITPQSISTGGGGNYGYSQGANRDFQVAASLGANLGALINKGIESHKKGEAARGLNALNKLQADDVANNLSTAVRWANYNKFFESSDLSATAKAAIRQSSPFIDKVMLEEIGGQKVNVMTSSGAVVGQQESGRFTDTPEDRKANAIEDSANRTLDNMRKIGQTFQSSTRAFEAHITSKIDPNSKKGQQIAANMISDLVEDIGNVQETLQDIKAKFYSGAITSRTDQKNRRDIAFSRLKLAYNGIVASLHSEDMFEVQGNYMSGTVSKNASSQVLQAFNEELRSIIGKDEELRTALGPDGVNNLVGLMEKGPEEIRKYEDNFEKSGDAATRLRNHKHIDLSLQLEESIEETSSFLSLAPDEKDLVMKEPVLRAIGAAMQAIGPETKSGRMITDAVVRIVDGSLESQIERSIQNLEQGLSPQEISKWLMTWRYESAGFATDAQQKRVMKYFQAMLKDKQNLTSTDETNMRSWLRSMEDSHLRIGPSIKKVREVLAQEKAGTL